ncbi:RNA polymerase factor sigma-54 [Borrelia anserina]|uniref:RNA polymerase sigma-54 factor rpoN n=2 Tax=Borrelia anserina TaxID=143 RepID=W5STU0_BORAN|nr:RNA polymerase factor sigma-54 [Borrelia anserina]AHH08426.1 RNA polymerase sigma-54 factor rpoN [Borrelia anserina BA2]APR64907.1 RNA polymerase sigma-54 factor [Borrelia anserina Es]UPA06829.1 RNA polymerase factor sigma-54 [Borrelia anserina]
MLKQNLKLMQKLQITQINTLKMLSLDKKELIKIMLNEIEHNEYLQVDSNKIFFETLKTYKFRKLIYREDNNNKTQYEIALAKKSHKPSLKEHLLLQLRIQRLSKTEINIGEIIINNLNSKGFHIINPYDFFKKEDWPLVTKMIELIQKFDPIGICVPNIIESLILQAKYHKLDTNIIKILERANLLENTQDRLKEELNINTQDLNDALNTIKLKLNPNPTFEFKDKNDTNNYIEPDIIVVNKDNKLKIKIKEVNIFKKEIKKQEVQDSKKYKQAKWLIESLRYRDETLAKIGIAIYTLQKEFLRRGFKSLRPMKLADISAKINLSKSTISRTIKNKYLKFDWGTIPIRKLFNSIGGAKTNEFPKLSIKLIIKEILEQNKNMVDSQISAILKSKGITISRRTVNKYRNELKLEGEIYGT